MTVELINILIQSVSTLLLIITVLFAWNQLREMSKQTKNLESTLKTSVYQDIIRSQRELWQSFFLRRPELIEWYLQSRDFEITNDRDNEIRMFTILKMDFLENLYLQYEEGTVPPNSWSGWLQGMKNDFSTEVFQEVWDKVGQCYAPTFTTFVNNELMPSKSKSL